MLPTVRSVMDPQTHAFAANEDIHIAVQRLVLEGVTGAPVVDGERLVGMLTELECLRLVTLGDSAKDIPLGTVADFMRTDFATVRPEMDIYHVAGLFLKNPRVRRFAVVDNDRLVAVITRKDILRAVGRRLRSETPALSNRRD